MKTCIICKEELKKFEHDFWTSDLWFCPTRHYSYEVLNQINESCYEYEEQIIFDSFALIMKQPHDIWEVEYSKQRWIGGDGGEIILSKKLSIEPFSLYPYCLETIKKKLETYITFA